MMPDAGNDLAEIGGFPLKDEAAGAPVRRVLLPQEKSRKKNSPMRNRHRAVSYVKLTSSPYSQRLISYKN